MIRKVWIVSICLVLLAACIPLPFPIPNPFPPATTATFTPDLGSIATQTAAALPTVTETASTPPSTTTTVEPLPVPSETPATETTPSYPTPPPDGGQQFLAYVSNGQLVVTDVTNGIQGGTTQYTMTGESDQVMDLAWSPSGELIAFTSVAQVDPHIFYIFALGQSSPTDLGPGSAPAWSPDSQSIAYVGGTFPDENIYMTSVENPSPRQLTFESNFAWGRPVFAPDGQSLIVAGTSRDNLGASGNTNFTLERLVLDGSGTRTPLPGATPYEGVRLPYDMRFSPDGSQLAFSTSYHLSACAAPGTYYVADPDGSNSRTLVSPSLQSFVDNNQEHYYQGLSFGWAPTSDAIAALGNVVDCNLNSPNPGQSIAGPQMSIIGLDNSERTIIPGFFYGISMDRTGAYIAGAHHQDGFQDPAPVVEVYFVPTGQLVLSLGPGNNPQFQP